MIICPNFSNPEVAREFEELKNATSEAAAYHIWSLNNGNAIDKAPNGALSRLFDDLLLHYKGDRVKAIQAKAKVYGASFLNWFGDWTGNATYEVYQGRTSEQPDGRRYNYWSRYENEAKTYGSNVRKVRINQTGFLFKNEQRWRTNLNGERVFDWGWSEEYEKVFAEFKEKTGYDYFDILENSKEGLAKQNEFFGFLESKGYKGYAEFNELELQGVEHDNAYTVTFGDNGIIDSDVSKVVDENGEPLIVWHTGAKNISIFNTDKVVYDKYGDPLIIPNAIYTTDSFETSISYEEEEQDLIGEYVEGKGIVYADPIFKSQTYPLFVSIKNPRIIDAKGKLWNKIEIDGKITTTRKIEEETWQSDYDGVIIKNVIDYGGNPIMPSYMTEQFEPSTVLISFNPNQIKSIDNEGPTPWEGTYSRENDNIYYQENSKDVAKFNELYLYEYNTELKLLKTTDFNPFDYFKGRDYVILSEKTSIKFNNYRSKVTKYKKDDKFGFPKQFFDEMTGLLYIKSNNYKNSRRYDVVNSRTGEVVKHGVTLFTCDEFEKQSYKVSQRNRFVPKTFNARRAINFALLRQMPSKNRYKMIAKLFIYDSVDPKEATINFEIIDRFVDSMPDALWDYISSDVYGFNEDMYIGPFYAGTTDTSNINAATFKVGTNLVSVNLPKLGLITFAEKMTGIKLLGRKVKFNSTGRKLPNKNRSWNEEVVLDNNLTRPEIEYLIHQILEREYFKESTEQENIEHYAKHHGKTVDEVRKQMDFADEEFDDMVSHEMNHFIKYYDWLWIEFVLNIEEQWRDVVLSYIKDRYQDKFTTNDVNYIVQYFSGLLPWIKIDFNTDSYSGENEPFLRLFSVIHEPFHALHALTYGSSEEIALRNSYKELIKTPFGKKLHDLVKNSLTKNVDEEGLYKETCAYMFQIINTPSEFILNGGDEFTASKIYELIKDIIELPIETVDKKVISTYHVEQEKEEYIKLSFFQKLYNAIISALHKIIPLTKQYIDLINNVVKVQQRVEVTTESTIIEETERSKLIQLLKNDFLTKLDEFEGAIKALQSVDDNVLSSVHIDDFFKKSKANYQELQNWSDDLQKTERELDLKDYLKSLRNTLNC